ncbi:MAG: hypothetical protein ACLF0G_06520 [Candidatus Brocadiia bacterium]
MRKRASPSVLAALLALSALCAAGEEPRLLTPQEVAELPPPPAADIPVAFTLERAGYVTLVVEDGEGRRVRNLVQDTWLDAGPHTLYWDGYDVGTPRYGGRKERGYDFVRHRVAPGTYRLRGLVHQGIAKRYLFPVQSPGQPPWMTDDGSGGWLGDHTPQTACLSLPDGSPYGEGPQVMIACSTAEGGHGLIWVTLEGRKLHGTKFGWSGALALARDRGPRRDPAASAYSVRARKGTAHLDVHRADGSHEPLFGFQGDAGGRTGGMGLAVRDRVAAISVPPEDRLLFVDVGGEKPRELASVPLERPKGLAVDAGGRLLAVTGGEVKAYAVDWRRGALGEGTTVATQGLEAPQGLVLGPDGALYVSDWGSSHQVKVFGPAGKLLRAIGKPGGQVYGAYDERRMCCPNGFAIDARGQLWVAETTYAPKRTSLWEAATGRFLRAFYGPPKYSAGGTLDPRDRSRFFYTGASGALKLGIAFALDWKAGTAKPSSIYCLASHLRRPQQVGRKTQAPELPVVVGGKEFMVTHIGNAAWAPRTIHVWEWHEGTRTVELVARVGSIKFWPPLREEPLKSRVPENANNKNCLYAWSDLNRDGQAQVSEVTFRVGQTGGQGFKHVQPDLALFAADGMYIPPPSLGPGGIPVWDLEKAGKVADFRDSRGEAVGCRDGFRINTRGPIEGWKDGRRLWQYHAQYPNRAPGPIPRYPGHLVKTARVVGPTIVPRGGEAGELWGMTGDYGSVYLFTSDGLYLTDLGGDQRVLPPLGGPARRGRLLGQVTFKSEHWWASLNQLEDTGEIVMQAGKVCSLLIRLEGFEAVRRRDFGSLAVTEAQLRDKPAATTVPAEWRVPRRAAVAIRRTPPRVDGEVGEWPPGAWLEVDARRNIRAAVAVAEGRLFAAYQVGEPQRLANTADGGWECAFASGGGLDLMVRTRPEAKPRKFPGHRLRDPRLAPGDVRLFIARIGDPREGRLLALRMEQAAGSGVELPAAKPWTYSSPIGQVAFDSIADVAAHVEAVQRGGTCEVAVPLAVLGLEVKPGLVTQADIGVLLGAGGETQARLYWAAGSAGMVADVPTEARLVPRTWGTWVFEAQKNRKEDAP